MSQQVGSYDKKQTQPQWFEPSVKSNIMIVIEWKAAFFYSC